MARNKVEIGIELKDRASRPYKAAAGSVASDNKKLIESSRALQTQYAAQSKSFLTGINAQRAAVLGLSSILTGKVSKSLIDTQKTVDRLNNSLKIGSGSANGAAKEYAFLEKESKRLGLELKSVGLSYAQLLVATKSGNITASETKEIFLGVAEAGAAMGLSADQVNGALLAFQQIASKGTVQAEELRGQLAERIPGAFSLAAKAMNVTEKQLNKMLERGEVTAKQMLPALAKELRSTFGPTAQEGPEKLNGKINALSNVVFDFQKKFLQSGGANLIGGSFELAADAVGVLSDNMGELLSIGKAVFAVYSAKKIMDIAKAMEANYIATRTATTTVYGYGTATTYATRSQWAFNGAVKALSFVGPLAAVTGFQLALDKLLNIYDQYADRVGGKDFLGNSADVQKAIQSLSVVKQLSKEAKSIQASLNNSRGAGWLQSGGVAQEQIDTLKQYQENLRVVKDLFGESFDPENANIDKMIAGLAATNARLTQVKKTAGETNDELEMTVSRFKELMKGRGIPGITGPDANKGITFIDLDAERKKMRAISDFQASRAKENLLLQNEIKNLEIEAQADSADKQIALLDNHFQRESILREGQARYLEQLEKTTEAQKEAIRKEYRDKDLKESQRVAAEKQAIIQNTLSSFSSIVSQFGQLAQIRSNNEIRALQDTERQEDRSLALKKASSRAERESIKAAQEREDKINELRKQAFEQQKKFSYLTAILNTAQAVTSAYATVPFIPAGLAAGGIALAKGGLEIATIKAQKFAQGGIIEGQQSGDRVPIMANGGEMVLNQSKQKRLLDIAEGRAGFGGSNITFGNIIVNVGSGDPYAIGRAVATTVQEKIRMATQLDRKSKSLQVRGA